MVKGKKIILGVTGSIAAYKSAFLVRLLVKQGAEVRVVMTEASEEFIGKLTFSVLSQNPVYSSFSNKETGEWINHVDLGRWADVMVIAPVSANTIAKMANGICDNLLLGVYLSAKCPVMLCPAMDLDMWQHAATKDNISRLKSFGHQIISPTYGELASGLTGEGRMEEPENILKQLEDFFSTSLSLKGKKVLVTAGPTYEKIDPVRFIGNRSSGKMGFALANEFAKQGAEVTLLSGPSFIEAENSSINRINVESTQEMFEACIKNYEGKDVIVMCAAVADYKPEFVGLEKIRKKNNSMILTLVPTQDILEELGKRRKKSQLLVGFALETKDELDNAKEKLQRKSLDMIVLNSLKDQGAGFGYDTNKVTIISRDLNVRKYDLKPKTEVAKDIIEAIVEHLKIRK